MRDNSGHRLVMVVSTIMLAVILLGSMLPIKCLPYNPCEVDLENRFVGVMGLDSHGGKHWLGTDALGRDVFSRLLFSGRYSLLVALGAALITTVTAVVCGLLAGYMGGVYDVIVMMAVDALLSFPVILLAVALAAVIGRGVLALTGILAFTGWASYTRVVRAEALHLRNLTFVEAARALGAKTSRVLTRTVLPNTISTLTVMSTFLIARFILIESSVSFLGMGIAPPASSWGIMVGEGKEYIFEAPFVSIFPGLMIVLTVMSVNFIGDGLRDIWDPRKRGSI